MAEAVGAIPAPESVLYVHPVGEHPAFWRERMPESLGARRWDYFPYMPVGLVGILNGLMSRGIPIRGINLPLKRMVDPSFGLEQYLLRERPTILLLDMHWYVHIKDGLRVAAIAKDLVGCTTVVGGISASLFHQQLVRHPAIDYVICGDAERALPELVDALRAGRTPSGVPNITSKEERCATRRRCEPGDLDGLDYATLDFLEDSERYDSMYDGEGWLFTGKGCPFHCAACDGPQERTRSLFGRRRSVFRSPESLVADLRRVRAKDIWFSLDLDLLPEAVIGALAEERFPVRLSNEFFQLADLDRLASLQGSFSAFHWDFTPVGGSEEERARYGKHFSNERFLDTLKQLPRGSSPVDVTVHFTEKMLAPRGTEELDSAARESLTREILAVVPNARIRTQPHAVDPGSLLPGMDLDEIYGFYSS